MELKRIITSYTSIKGLDGCPRLISFSSSLLLGASVRVCQTYTYNNHKFELQIIYRGVHEVLLFKPPEWCCMQAKWITTVPSINFLYCISCNSTSIMQVIHTTCLCTIISTSNNFCWRYHLREEVTFHPSYPRIRIDEGILELEYKFRINGKTYTINKGSIPYTYWSI